MISSFQRVDQSPMMVGSRMPALLVVNVGGRADIGPRLQPEAFDDGNEHLRASSVIDVKMKLLIELGRLIADIGTVVFERPVAVTVDLTKDTKILRRQVSGIPALQPGYCDGLRQASCRGNA